MFEKKPPTAHENFNGLYHNRQILKIVWYPLMPSIPNLYSILYKIELCMWDLPWRIVEHEHWTAFTLTMNVTPSVFSRFPYNCVITWDCFDIFPPAAIKSKCDIKTSDLIYKNSENHIVIWVLLILRKPIGVLLNAMAINWKTN